MSELERELLDQAIRQFGRIRPCAGKSLPECFLRRDGQLQFWFNDARGNTHLLCSPERVLVP